MLGRLPQRGPQVSGGCHEVALVRWQDGGERFAFEVETSFSG
jgi:hypothetical protein